MSLFREIVENILNENKRGPISYETLKKETNIINGPLYLYHMTGKANLEGGILKGGMERYYDKDQAHGPGVYTCLRPGHDSGGQNFSYLSDSERAGIYGGKGKSDSMSRAIMIVCRLNKKHPLENVLIFDEPLARKIYGHKWRIKDQLDVICGDLIENVKQEAPGDYYRLINLDYERAFRQNTGSRLYAHLCSNSKTASRCIDGDIFHSYTDGFVYIVKDYTAVEPIGISYDLGHTFFPLKVEDTFERFVKSNKDLRFMLGLNSMNRTYKTNIITDRRSPFNYLPQFLIDGHAKCGKIINGEQKWNYIDGSKVTDDFRRHTNPNYNSILVSPYLWFDKCSDTLEGGQAVVSIENERFFIKKQGDNYSLYNNYGEMIGALNSPEIIENLNNYLHPKEEDLENFTF